MTPNSADRAGRRGAKGSLQVAAKPLVGYFDRRFQELNDRLDDRLGKVYERVETEVETISEMTLGMQRFVDIAGQELREVADDLRRIVADLQRLVDRLPSSDTNGETQAEHGSNPADEAGG